MNKHLKIALLAGGAALALVAAFCLRQQDGTTGESNSLHAVETTIADKTFRSKSDAYEAFANEKENFYNRSAGVFERSKSAVATAVPSTVERPRTQSTPVPSNDTSFDEVYREIERNMEGIYENSEPQVQPTVDRPNASPPPVSSAADRRREALLRDWGLSDHSSDVPSQSNAQPMFRAVIHGTQLLKTGQTALFRTGYTSNDAVSQNDGRVLYIQPVDVLPESNLNVITSDGRYYAFDVCYDDAATTVNYIIEPAMSFFREAPKLVSETEPADVSEPEIPNTHIAETSSRIWQQVRSMPSYIKVNNIARLQKLAIILNGVYVDAEHVYFRFSLENGSNVPFDVDYIAFSIGAKKSKKTSTQERVQLFPVDSDKRIHRVDAKSRCEAIYRFEKFTIGKDKVLLAEVLEAGGDRNIALPIPEHFIIEARHL